MITIVIPGEPIPKMRHRQSKWGSTFDPQVDAKNAVKWHIKHFIKEHFPDIEFPLAGPVHCEFYFYMPMPEHFTQAEKSLISWNAMKHVSKPDCDNLEKFYLDCMSKIVYEDDRRIYSLSTLKRYDIYPRTEIRIMVGEKTIMKKVKEILSLFPREELEEFAQDLEIVADCIDKEFLNKKEEAQEKLQREAAEALSIFADRYAAALYQITKKYPGAWKSISEFEKNNYKEISTQEKHGDIDGPKSLSEPYEGN